MDKLFAIIFVLLVFLTMQIAAVVAEDGSSSTPPIKAFH